MKQGIIMPVLTLAAFLFLFSAGCSGREHIEDSVSVSETQSETADLADDKVSVQGINTSSPGNPATLIPEQEGGSDREETDDMSEATLLCKAETRAEAEEIAGQYNITLVRYHERSKLAAFVNTSGMTDAEVIKTGKENGWTILECMHIYTAFS